MPKDTILQQISKKRKYLVIGTDASLVSQMLTMPFIKHTHNGNCILWHSCYLTFLFFFWPRLMQSLT